MAHQVLGAFLGVVVVLLQVLPGQLNDPLAAFLPFEAWTVPEAITGKHHKLVLGGERADLDLWLCRTGIRLGPTLPTTI